MDPRARELFEEAFEHHKRGEFQRAIELYQASIDACPSAEAYTFMGWAYSHMGDLERAIELCQKAITTDPDFGNPYNDIGAYLIQMGRAEEAIPWLERATEASRYESPQFPHMNLGRVYLRQHNYQEAARSFERALEIDPNYRPARVQLARLRAMFN
ncbi:MAG: tetratricopeptide repeat protein [Nitrospinota bacterium]